MLMYQLVFALLELKVVVDGAEYLHSLEAAAVVLKY